MLFLILGIAGGIIFAMLLMEMDKKWIVKNQMK